MKLHNLLIGSILTSAWMMPIAIAQPDRTFTDNQKKQIEQIVHDYLLKNPEILVEVSKTLQQKQQQTMLNKAQAVIKENANELLNDSMTSLGAAKGNITLVEFFDYQCIHCKKMAPVINKLIKENNQLHVVYKEFPIFGQSSEMASKAALAAAMQGKYQAMHDILITQEERLTDDKILELAKKIGLNMEQYKKDIDSPKVNHALEANRKLAEKLHLMGTPAFIIAASTDGHLKANSEPVFIPGAASSETLQSIIKKQM